MTISSNVQTNTLKANQYRLIFNLFPDVDFFIQSFDFPEIIVGGAEGSYKKHDVAIQGSSLNYGDLNLTFLIDSEFTNFMTMYSWVVQNSEVCKYSELSILLLDDFSNTLKSVEFFNVFPTRLSGLKFDNRVADDLSASVSLKYSSWEFTI